jgi:hypothetical protein
MGSKLQTLKETRDHTEREPVFSRKALLIPCLIGMVPMEGVEPTHSYEYQILSLARLPIPPHRLPAFSLAL